MVKTFENLLLQNQEAHDLETWYTASGTQSTTIFFSNGDTVWVDLDHFYDIVKFVS